MHPWHPNTIELRSVRSGQRHRPVLRITLLQARRAVLRSYLVSVPNSAIASALERSISGHREVRAAFLFGSRVKGTFRADSDLDLAIAFDPETSEHRRTQIKLDVIDAATKHLGKLGERLDIMDLDRANSAIAFRAVLEGTVISERTRADRVQVVARVCARAADDAFYQTRATRMAKERLRKML
jgi:predicted nucleotidyltransferase